MEEEDIVKSIITMNKEEEWECLECGQRGSYMEIRKPIDFGVDRCPNCSEEVKCLE